MVRHVFEFFDFAGEKLMEAQEILMLEEIHGLLFVVDLSINEQLVPNNTHQLDEERIQEQIDAYRRDVLRFFLDSPRITKTCRSVVLFINKSDVIGGRPEEADAIARQKFAPLIEAFEAFKDNVELKVLVGSAWYGHNTHVLMPHFIRELLPENAFSKELLRDDDRRPSPLR